MTRRAVLDPDGRLVGARTSPPDPVAEDGSIPVDPGDLPLDGTYRWTGATFVPEGHELPRVSTKPPVAQEHALYHVVRALGPRVAREAREWADWFERSGLLERHTRGAAYRRQRRTR